MREVLAVHDQGKVIEVVRKETYDDLAAELAHFKDCHGTACDLLVAADSRLQALEAALRGVMPLLAECDCIYSDRDAPLCPCRAARALLTPLETGGNPT